MDTRNILDRLLERSQQATNAGIGMADDGRAGSAADDERVAMLKGAGAGALGAGAVALLFGSKGTRKFAKKAAKLGGTAALGGLAYKVYTDWQAQQEASGAGAAGMRAEPRQLNAAASPSPSLNLAQFEVGEPIDALPERQASERGEALMKAMISAAKADGHVDAAEQALITRQVDALGLEQDLTRLLLAEMAEPADVTRIAALADTRETAAELYVASAMVADADDPAGRAYLDSLADALALDPTVTRGLEEPLRT